MQKNQFSPQGEQNGLTLFRKNPLFKSLSAETLNLWSSQIRSEGLHRGKVLFMQDDTADWVYMIVSGWIKLFRETVEGEEVVLDVRSSGALMGETTFFTDRVYSYGAEAAEDSVVLVFPSSLISREVAVAPAFSMALMKHMAQDQARRDKEIEHRTLQNAPQRIGCFLLRLCDPHEKGPVTLRLPYDKTLIAASLGMQPETFSRALARLQDETSVTVKGAMVDIAQVSDLVTYTCRSCSNVFPCEDMTN